MMIIFLGSMLNITMLELSIELSINKSANLYLSKVCGEQCLKALVYACDEAHIYQIFSCYSCVFDLPFDKWAIYMQQ